MRAYSPVLAVIDEISVDKWWLRSSKAKISDWGLSIIHVAEAVVPYRLLQSQKM